MKGGVPALAAAMGRSVSSIKIRATKMHLGPWLNASEFVTLNMLFRILLGRRESSSYMYIRLIKLGLPTIKRRNQKTQFQMVRIEDFWKWAEAHQRELDFSDFEEGGLGAEPEWAKRKRRRDRENKRLMLPKKSRWSLQEDELLRLMCERGTTWLELDAAFQRSSAAIRRRIYDLALPHPSSKRGRGEQNTWSVDDLEKVARLSQDGYSVDAIARQLGRSSQSIRGKLEWLKKREC